MKKEMANNVTELVFILDRSGSMSGLESDTIGGFNSMLQKQKKEDGAALITTVLFDDQYEVLHDRVNMKQVQTISDNEYFVRGTTALLDAVGRTIHRMVEVQKQAIAEGVSHRFMFVIITDGMENASKEFSYDQMKTLIEHQKQFYNWEFIFLGANIDAVATASQLGIRADRAANYHADAEGVMLNFSVVNEAVKAVRANRELAMDWSEEIDKDYQRRTRQKKS
jgi:uncharacterized protein YegL